MVEDRVTDGRRIAELLASELDGRSDGPLESVAVVNAAPDVEPGEGRNRAYDVAVSGSTAATVFVRPERVRIETSLEKGDVDRRTSDGLSIRQVTGAGAVVVVGCGAAVKRAVDFLVDAIEENGRE